MAAAQSFNEGSPSTDPEDTENKKFFNKELTRNMKEHLIWGPSLAFLPVLQMGCRRRSVSGLWRFFLSGAIVI